MFIGEYSHSLDAKGRLIVPAKFREGLGEHFIVTKGIDRCLYIYPRSEWEVFEAKLRQLPLANADAAVSRDSSFQEPLKATLIIREGL